VRDWDGSWLTAVVTSVGEDARTRSELRKMLQDSRFGELREGSGCGRTTCGPSWIPDIARHVRLLRSVDEAPAELAARLWDLVGWAATAVDLIAAMSRARDLPTEFAIAAAMVRHLRTDPVLPEELVPRDWPGWRLRAEYQRFADGSRSDGISRWRRAAPRGRASGWCRTSAGRHG
jgi:phenylacetic acid degradation operon negative regulatory protein